MQLNSAVQDHRLNKRIEYFNQQSSWINILTKTPFEVLHNPLEFIAQLSHFRGTWERGLYLRRRDAL